MLLHQFENLRGDARPNAGASLDTRGRGWTTAKFGGYFAERTHVFDGHHDFDLHRFAGAGIDNGNRSRCAIAITTQKACDFFERALRGRQPDALGGHRGEFFEAFERQCQVRSTFGGSNRMDFVDNDRVDVGQRRARRRSEHEIQTFGRGNQHVWWMAQHALAITSTGVAGAQGHCRFAKVVPESFGSVTDSDNGCPQVFFNVKGQCAKW